MMIRSALGPQLLHGHISSPVPAGPTCNVTGEAMPTSLAEALTQLSFLEFLQRCNLSIAPPQLPQLPVSISPPDAAMQTTSRSTASQDVSTQMGTRPASSFLLTQLCRRLYAVFCHTILPHNYRLRSSLLDPSESSTGVLWDFETFVAWMCLSCRHNRHVIQDLVSQGLQKSTSEFSQPWWRRA